MTELSDTGQPIGLVTLPAHSFMNTFFFIATARSTSSRFFSNRVTLIAPFNTFGVIKDAIVSQEQSAERAMLGSVALQPPPPPLPPPHTRFLGARWLASV